MLARNLLLISLLTLVGCAASPEPKPLGSQEAHYRDAWCAQNGGETEVSFPGSRVDCVTDTHAVELDWARKWAECVGQALRYGSLPYPDGKPRAPLCVLILKKPSDQKYVDRIKDVIEAESLRLEVQTITREDL